VHQSKKQFNFTTPSQNQHFMKPKANSTKQANPQKKNQSSAFDYFKKLEVKQKNFKGNRNNTKAVIVRPR
jgi:hypothetical protein